MKPDLLYIDGDSDIEPFIKAAISELETLFPLERGYNEKDYFNQLSHTKFALKMLLQEIREHRDVSPYIVVEEFARRMDRYSCENIETSFIFSVAYDAAQSVLNEAAF